MTSRRGFLGALIGAAVLDPERLLWRPGAKLISVPRPPITFGISVQYVRAYNSALDLVTDRFRLYDPIKGVMHFVERINYLPPDPRQLPPEVRAQLAHLGGVSPERLVLGASWLVKRDPVRVNIAE